jgi:hypothetical protein
MSLNTKSDGCPDILYLSQEIKHEGSTAFHGRRLIAP